MTTSASAAILAATQGGVHLPGPHGEDLADDVVVPLDVLSIAGMLGRDPLHDVPAPSKKRTAEDIIRQAKAAERVADGLPPIADITWMQAQIWDAGEGTKGKARFNLKLLFSTIKPALLDRSKVKSVRYCALSETDQFWAGVRRRRSKMAAWDVAAAEQFLAIVKSWNKVREEGQPEARIGAISYKLAGSGTIIYPGQYAVIEWSVDAEAEGAPWVPVLMIVQAGDGIEAIISDGIDLKDHRDDEDRHPYASDYVGHLIREDYRQHMDACVERREAAKKAAA